MENLSAYLRKITLFLSILMATVVVATAQALNDNGNSHTINANGSTQSSGSVQDYTIPTNSLINSISFTLKGGDGGYAKAGDDCKSNGGAGATTTATFPIGTGNNELKPGGTIRFIVGKHGKNGDVGGSNSTTGGGGGGTAILYRPNTTADWNILAVAGGGGGAHQGNVFGGCVDSQLGQGGRSAESGGDGEGTNSGAGGTNGNGGSAGPATNHGDGGGGAYSDGGSSSGTGGLAGLPDGGQGSSSQQFGGYGFGGGGAGGYTGGGGGGGYSGGGGGATYNNGGGGGSYINSTFAISSSKTEGGLGGGNSQNGYVNYQFNNTYVSWTGNVSSSWTNSANWENNVMPNSNSLIIIPSGVPNFPEITTTVNIKALEIQANAELWVDPSGTLNVNNSPSVGIRVSGILTNSGLIQINNTGSHGLAVDGDQNATAYLYGDTNIGNNGTINGAGIYLSGSLVVDRDPNYTNQTDFTPTVSIDNTSGNGIHSLHGEITITETIYGVLVPTSTINIGTSGNIGSNGILNIGSFNLSKGTINIQNTTSYGLLNTAFFGNGNTVIGGGGILNIGSASNSVGGGGIYNQVNCSISNSGTINIQNTAAKGIENMGSFTNNTAGSIYIDQTTDDGVLNTATFNNKGAIIIGSVAYLGGDGIWNEGYFKNFSDGSIIVNRAVTGIMNVNGTFTNEGLFEFGESVAIYIPGSNQVPWAIRNEDAVGGNNPIFLNNSCTAVIHIFQAGIRDPINGFTNNAVILQESILTQVAWASNIHTNNGFILYNHGSFSADNGISPFSISGDFSGKKFWTGCASTTWGASNNWYPNGIPTVADNLVIYPQVNDPLIAVATPALGKTLDLKDGATLTNHGRLTLANNFWVRSGATVQGDGEYFLSNNFTVSNGGTFLPGTSIVTMEGNGNRTIGNTPLSFYDLVIDKSSSNQVTINTDVTVTNSITVTSGELEIPAGSSLAGSATLQVSGTITNNGSLTLTGPGLVVNPLGNLQGNGQYTLYGDFALLGAFDAGTSTMTFSGSGNQFISGGADFYNLVINKPSGYARTSSSITVANELDLVSGNFNLTGGDIELIGNGIIVGESAASYIYSSTGTGEVHKTVDLNAPLAENPGNIGATISSSANLGVTTIYRRHRAIDLNGETSILRSYYISPANNSGLNATLRLQYLEHELNGNAENDLFPYTFSNFVWADYPVSARNTTANWVEAENIASFSTTWTLAASCVASTTFYADNDGDGYGDPAVSGLFCNAPEGYVADNTDCNDNDATINPGATEICDGIDNDCDGLLDSNDPNFVDNTLPTPDCTNMGSYVPVATQRLVAGSYGYVAQVITPTEYAAEFVILLELNTCKVNGIVDAQLDIVSVTSSGEPNWTDVLGTAIVPAAEIYGLPGCQGGTFGTSAFSYSGVSLQAGTQYALVLKLAPGSEPGGSIGWRRSSTPTDPSNPYTGGRYWEFFVNEGESFPGNPSLDLQFEVLTCMTLPTITAECGVVMTPPTASDNCAGTVTATTTDPTSYTEQGTYTVTWTYDDGNGNTTTQMQTVIVNAPELSCYLDSDQDGFGDPNVEQAFCDTCGDGYVLDNTDCDDNDANEFPGQAWFSDFDNDGYSGGSALASCERPDGHKLAGELLSTSIFDCDDNDPSVYTMQVWYEDQDDDQYTTGIILSSCQRPAGYKSAGELVNTTDIDCNDNNAAVNPGATEICNGIDDNCNSQTDEGVQSTYYADADGDGYGDPADFVSDCSTPDGYVANNSDCDDNDTDEFPGQTWYEDADNDGYSTGMTQTACERPAGYRPETELVNTTTVDCNDDNAAINPLAKEICDGIDNNCDGLLDGDDPNYVDNTPPMTVCIDATYTMTGEASLPIEIADIWDEANSTDNCGEVFYIEQSVYEVTCDQVGTEFPVTVTVEDEHGNPATCVATVTVEGLPCGWQIDPAGLGCDPGEGAFSAPGTFTLTSEGCYDPTYYRQMDQHGFIQQELCGDGEIIAQVTEVIGTGWAGISMRESNDPSARMLQLMIDGQSLTRRELRNNPNSPAYTHMFQTQGKNWLRLSRVGNQFAAARSLDGVQWEYVLITQIPMTSCIHVGLITMNGSSTGEVTAQFENVLLNNGAIAPLAVPSGIDADIAGLQPGQMDVYPNPTRDQAILNLSGIEAEQGQLRIFNQQGQLMQEIRLDLQATSTIKLDLRDFDAGLYLLRLETEHEFQLTKKIIKN